jgi:hypothetical protein
MHLGNSFTIERFYTDSIGRSSLSIETLKEIPLRVSALHRCKASFHGLSVKVDKSTFTFALQSFKELKGRLNSCDFSRPP